MKSGLLPRFGNTIAQDGVPESTKRGRSIYVQKSQR
jgi:hypothetical protein